MLALATLIAAFGSSFQYGYNVAAVNSPALVGHRGEQDVGGRLKQPIAWVGLASVGLFTQLSSSKGRGKHPPDSTDPREFAGTWLLGWARSGWTHSGLGSRTGLRSSVALRFRGNPERAGVSQLIGKLESSLSG